MSAKEYCTEPQCSLKSWALKAIRYRQNVVSKILRVSNQIGMYLLRKGKAIDGVYSAKSYKFKPPTVSGLKPKSYFLSEDACILLEREFSRKASKRKRARSANPRKSLPVCQQPKEAPEEVRLAFKDSESSTNEFIVPVTQTQELQYDTTNYPAAYDHSNSLPCHADQTLISGNAIHSRFHIQGPIHVLPYFCFHNAHARPNGTPIVWLSQDPTLSYFNRQQLPCVFSQQSPQDRDHWILMESFRNGQEFCRRRSWKVLWGSCAWKVTCAQLHSLAFKMLLVLLSDISFETHIHSVTQ